MGVDVHTATKLLVTAIFVAGVIVVRWLARALVRLALRGRDHIRGRFWSRQGINLATTVVVALGLISIWFDNGLHAAAAVGLLTAAFAFAMQKAVTSVAGYFLILRGDIFSIGDRIVMGGVRGDVIALGFLRTTILEMGQPSGDEDAGVPMWVQARQYTGRIVTVTNGAVFDEPVYNYSRDFPFIWEELHIQVKHDTDLDLAERLMADAARRHCLQRDDIGSGVMQHLRRRYFVPAQEVSVEPEVFFTLTSSWVEIALRFVVATHDIRRVKSSISRDVAAAFAEHHIAMASNTYAIVEVPALKVESEVTAGRPYPDEPRSSDAGSAPRSAAADSDDARRSRAATEPGSMRPTP